MSWAKVTDIAYGRFKSPDLDVAEEFLTPQPTEADLQHELLDEGFGESLRGSGE